MSRSRSSFSSDSQSGGCANHMTLVMIARFVGRSMRSQAASMALMLPAIAPKVARTLTDHAGAVVDPYVLRSDHLSDSVADPLASGGCSFKDRQAVPLLLGLIHCRVGALDELLSRGGVGVRAGDPDARTQL